MLSGCMVIRRHTMNLLRPGNSLKVEQIRSARACPKSPTSPAACSAKRTPPRGRSTPRCRPPSSRIKITSKRGVPICRHRDRAIDLLSFIPARLFSGDDPLSWPDNRPSMVKVSIGTCWVWSCWPWRMAWPCHRSTLIPVTPRAPISAFPPARFNILLKQQSFSSLFAYSLRK